MNPRHLQQTLQRFVPGKNIEAVEIYWFSDYNYEETNEILNYLLAQNIIETCACDYEGAESSKGFRLKISFEQQQKLLLL